jgi:hypothetical protein
VRGVLARAGHDNVVTLLITGDMASAELAALALQGIPVLHKPVTPARLRRTLEMLWQQAELDKGRATTTLALRDGVDAGGGAGREAAVDGPPRAAGGGSQTRPESESQK